jgi:hypothetical protein
VSIAEPKNTGNCLWAELCGLVILPLPRIPFPTNSCLKGLHMDHRLRRALQPWSCPRCSKLNPENYSACRGCFEPKVKRESEREQPSLKGKPATVTHHSQNVLMFKPDDSLAVPSSDRHRQYPQLLVLRCWDTTTEKGKARTQDL